MSGVSGALGSVLAPNPAPLTLNGTRTYLLGERRLVVLDPGPDEEGHAAAIVEAVAGRPVEAVCLTHAHADHAAGAERTARELRAPLVASGATLERLDVEGRAVADGEDVPVDGGRSTLRALETPGHTADGLSWLWLPGRELFTGDLVLGRGSSLVVYPDGHVGACLASLARLAALLPSRILPGHGPAVEDAAGKLAEYRRHRLERSRQVWRAVQGGARTLEELRRAVYGELDDGLSRAAELSLLAHLVHLRETGHDLPPEVDALTTAQTRGAPR